MRVKIPPYKKSHRGCISFIYVLSLRLTGDFIVLFQNPDEGEEDEDSNVEQGL